MSILCTNSGSFATYEGLAASVIDVEAGKILRKGFRTKMMDFIVQFHNCHITMNTYTHIIRL